MPTTPDSTSVSLDKDKERDRIEVKETPIPEKDDYAATPTLDNSQPIAKSSKIPRVCLSVLDLLLTLWVIPAMGLLVLLAYFFPSVGMHGGYIASQYTVTYGCVAIIFFVSGLSLPTRNLALHAINWRLHLLVQVNSFLIMPAVIFGVAAGIESAGSKTIDTSMFIGLITTGCLPTTISSNVVMTRLAGGDESATMVEVTIGNLIGPFISPLLITKLFLPAVPAFEQWLPPQATSDLTGLYSNVMMQIGLSVFVPLAVGQAVQLIWTDRVKWAVAKFRLGKVGSVCLLAIIWSTFCTAFATHTLQTASHSTIILNVFLNITLCTAFTGFAFVIARPPMFLNKLAPGIFKRIPKQEAVSVCFCVPAKTQALGIPLIAAMWKTSDDQTRALIEIPVVLYTAEQILVGQVFVYVFKRWLARGKEGRDSEKEERGGQAVVVASDSV